VGVKVSLRIALTRRRPNMKYSGIDLHSNNSVVVVTDESDRIITSRRVPNSLPSVLAVL
jgi:hypothetical protein